MKKTYLSIIMLIACISLGYAQTTLFSDTFESYTAGQKLVQQAPGSDWTTWSNAPGGAEDPIVSNAQSHSATKSVKIALNNDLVLLLHDKNIGRYQLKFFTYTPAGKIGYFNVLQDFAASNSIWGMELYFNADGTGTVNAGGVGSGSFTYPQGAWIPVNMIIDLDDDFATLYVNDQEVVSWKWSGGSSGTNTLVKLDAVDFYGPADGGTAETYYDDVEFIEQVSVGAPSNLVAEVAGPDINLSWDAPVTGTPDKYSLMRNGSVVNSAITATTYTDANLYPNTYVYQVRAHYPGLGYSNSSNTDEGTIEGGVDRNLVLYEIGTGTWCQYCPGAAKGADDMVKNGHDVAIIEYHYGDGYEITPSTDRILYYGISAYPTTKVDGILGMVGGNASTSLYPSYLTMYNQRKPVPSVHIVDLEVEHVSGNNYRANITVEQANGYFPSGLVLQTVLTESHIPDVWLGGLTEVNFVCRNMFPDAYGTALDFSTSNTQTVSLDFSVTGYTFENLEFVAFIQHNPTAEIVQTVKHIMLFTGLKEDPKLALTAYPNPATHYINLQSNTTKPVSFMITDILGRVFIPMAPIKSELTKIDVSNWKSGVYIVKTDDGCSRKITVVN